MADGPDTRTHPAVAEVALTPEGVQEMRRDMVAKVNELFAALGDLAEADQMERLVRLAERFERERDEAQEELTRVRRELTIARARSNDSAAFKHAASIKDAAVTMRSTMKGITDMPLTHPESARVIGQVNKAVVTFDEATAGMLS